MAPVPEHTLCLNASFNNLWGCWVCLWKSVWICEENEAWVLVR